MNARPLAPVVAILLISCVGCAKRSMYSPNVPDTNRFPTAAVAADHSIASEAGAEMLRRGGNAVDAAVATSFALSVVRPYSCGIGGGGFMIIHFRNDPQYGTQSIALNYREMAPAGVGEDFYEKLPDDPQASTRGGKAVGVPGTVAGLMHALEHFGTLDRATVLAPAIRAAEEGFLVDDHYLGSVRELIEWYSEDDSRKARFRFVWERFLKQGDVSVGDRIALPEQAAALRLIADRGADAFYKGRIALEILSAARRDGGPMRAEDLLNYEVARVEPLRFEAFGHTFLTMPPPSSGGVAMAQALGMLQRRRGELGRRPNSPDYVHLSTEALKHAFADRARWMGDPAKVVVPVDGLLAPAYLAERAASIDLGRTREIDTYGTVPPDDAGTSHFCVIDANGNAVACTETINLTFGSLVAVEKYGFCLNNEMDDFTTKRGEANAFGLRQSDRNLPSPGKRPLSSMTPTIVLDREGRAVLIAGASGGPRIITGTMQSILNVLLFNMDAQQALASPRFHHQWMPDVLQFERGWHRTASGDGTVGQLEARGHTVQATGSVGNVQLIRRDGRDGTLDAACDPRKGGRPAGF